MTSSRKSLILTLLAALVVGLCAITRQSLWMDEGSTAFKALLPDLRSWWQMTLHLGGSDVQMPVYMFLVWVWNKLGASSEYALRCINLPWLLLGAVALRKVRYWPLVFLSSPFMWYYTGELRPYAMQVAGGCLAAAGLIGIAENEEGGHSYRGLHAAACASLILAMSSLTGALWVAGVAAGTLVLQPAWLKQRAFWMRALPWVAAGLVMAAYYGFTILKGYRAAGSDRGLASMIFGFYELSGLGGLGSGRNEIRANPQVLAASAATLLIAASLLLISWLQGIRWWLRTTGRRQVAAAVIAAFTPVLMLAAVGLFKDFQVLGRHLSPLLPVVLIPLAIGVDQWKSSRPPLRLAIVAALLVHATSALGYRLLQRHERDDYRSASAIAFKALQDGESVMWQADMNATRYYAYQTGGAALINFIQSLESNPPSSLMFADLVVINRPDLRYRGVDYRKQLESNHFVPAGNFTGFEIWRSH